MRCSQWDKAKPSMARATHVNTRARVGLASSNLFWGNGPAMIRSSGGGDAACNLASPRLALILWWDAGLSVQVAPGMYLRVFQFKGGEI